MSLSDEQILFTADLAALILYANSLDGHTVALKEVFRPPETAKLYAAQGKGITRSWHTLGLAADVALFIDRKYQTDSESYRRLGEWWEARRIGNVWGGSWARADGNHFERRLLNNPT